MYVCTTYSTWAVIRPLLHCNLAPDGMIVKRLQKVIRISWGISVFRKIVLEQGSLRISRADIWWRIHPPKWMFSRTFEKNSTQDSVCRPPYCIWVTVIVQCWSQALAWYRLSILSFLLPKTPTNLSSYLTYCIKLPWLACGIKRLCIERCTDRDWILLCHCDPMPSLPFRPMYPWN